MSRWYRLELLSAFAGARLSKLAEDQRRGQATVHIGNGAAFLAVLSVAPEAVPQGGPLRAAAGPAFQAEVSDQDVRLLGQLIGDRLHRQGSLYIGNMGELLTVLGAAEIPAPVPGEGRLSPSEPEPGQ